MRTKQANILTDAILLVFRVNGQLLGAGDALVVPLGLTSARWQMLGAVALGGHALTAPQIAAVMGVSRQGAQKQLNVLVAQGLMEALPNASHKRSPLYALTSKGRAAYAAADKLQAKWANGLAKGMSSAELESARRLLAELSGRLARSSGNEHWSSVKRRKGDDDANLRRNG
jgi:DNA-binding MarR family transcriptional regulator